jgi:small subunit ribosomal protein S3
MAQKIHPKGFRLGFTQDYSTKWFTKDASEYTRNVYQDACIRQYLSQVYPTILDIRIERQSQLKSAFSTLPKECKVHVILHEGKNLTLFSPYARKMLKIKSSSNFKKRLHTDLPLTEVESALVSALPFNENLKLIIETSKNEVSTQAIAFDIQNALFLAQKKNNLKFKAILKRIKQSLIKDKSIKGFKVQLSGQSSGSLIAATEYVLHGQLPRQTIRIPIDYTAFDFPTKTGLVGVKIWIYHGQTFGQR